MRREMGWEGTEESDGWVAMREQGEDAAMQRRGREGSAAEGVTHPTIPRTLPRTSQQPVATLAHLPLWHSALRSPICSRAAGETRREETGGEGKHG